MTSDSQEDERADGTEGRGWGLIEGVKESRGKKGEGYHMHVGKRGS